MIKLFWNTQNQKKSITENEQIKSKEELDFKWGIYHQKNSDKWIYEILKKIKYNIINIIYYYFLFVHFSYYDFMGILRSTYQRSTIHNDKLMKI